MFNLFKRRTQIAKQKAASATYNHTQTTLDAVKSKHANRKAPTALYKANCVAKTAVLQAGDRV